MLFATVKALETRVVPMPKACAHVRKNPVMRLTMTRPLMSAADRPTSSALASSSSASSMESPETGSGAGVSTAPGDSTGSASEANMKVSSASVASPQAYRTGRSSSQPSAASSSRSPSSRANWAVSSARTDAEPDAGAEAYWAATMNAAVSTGRAEGRSATGSAWPRALSSDALTEEAPAAMRNAVVSSGEAAGCADSGAWAAFPSEKCAPRGRWSIGSSGVTAIPSCRSKRR